MLFSYAIFRTTNKKLIVLSFKLHAQMKTIHLKMKLREIFTKDTLTVLQWSTFFRLKSRCNAWGVLWGFRCLSKNGGRIKFHLWLRVKGVGYEKQNFILNWIAHFFDRFIFDFVPCDNQVIRRWTFFLFCVFNSSEVKIRRKKERLMREMLWVETKSYDIRRGLILAWRQFLINIVRNPHILTNICSLNWGKCIQASGKRAIERERKKYIKKRQNRKEIKRRPSQRKSLIDIGV